mgnify:CR=1 FL=1
MDYDEVPKRLGKRIREIRENRGWSQDVLAELSGLNRSYIGSLERAEHNVGIRSIASVANAFGVPIERLFERTYEIEELPETSSRNNQEPHVLINRNTFFELLKQCALDRPDLVAIYLERCGVIFIQNLN